MARAGRGRDVERRGRQSTAETGSGRRIGGRRLLRVAISLKPYVIVFVASACVLIIEIVAGRLLAPIIGVSLYTWTTIIGVVLAGISIGNYLGGRVADRFPSQTTLGLILLGGGVSSLGVLPLFGLVSGAFLGMSYLPRIVLFTVILFLLPSLILGMVTPVVIKLRLQDLSETGNVVGKIYAVATTGSIFGTFITGFVLIQWIGTRSILILVALVLVLMALAFGNLWRAKAPSVASLALFLSLGSVSLSSGALNSDCTRESNYFCILVEDGQIEGLGSVKRLSLDHLVHSFVFLEDPTLLAYGYEKLFVDIAAYVAQRNPSLHVLFIGGGGYTMPRYLEVLYPQSSLEVIEIDPAVTSVAFEYLGLRPDTRIVTHNDDARMVIPRLASGSYDLVIGDAFHDVAIPFHLTTREFNEQVRTLLDDEGIYAINVIDKLHTGTFLRAYVNTLQRTFPYVHVIGDDPGWENDGQITYLVVGSPRPLTAAALEDASVRSGRDEPVSHIMPEATFDSWLNSRRSILLTDDHAPVANLMAPLHLASKVRLGQAATHYNAGLELHSQGRIEEAIAEYDQAIRLDSALGLAYLNRAGAYGQLGQHQRAIQDYDGAIRLDPEFVLAYLNRGSAYVTLGQFQRAIQDLDEAIRLDPMIAEAYASRGGAYGSLGQFQRAIRDLDEAIRLNPSDARAHTNRGTSYARLGQYQRAIQDLGEAIRLDPQEAAAYDNRGSAYALLGDLQRAIQDFDRALRLNDRYAPAYYNRGTAYANLGQYQRAIQDLDEAIRLNPQASAPYANRALVYTRLDMDAQAQRDLDQAVELGFDRSLLEMKIEALKTQR